MKSGAKSSIFLDFLRFFSKKSVFTVILLLAAVLLSSGLNEGAAAGEGQLSVGSASGAPGSPVNIAINFTAGSPAISSFQFDLSLPAGISYSSIETGPAATAAGKFVDASLMGQTLQVLVIGFNNDPIGSGVIATLTLSIGGAVAAGAYPLAVSEVFATDPDAQSVPLLSQNGSLTVTGGGGGDTVPPVISGIAVFQVSINTMQVNWQTNEPADSQVGYGLTACACSLVSPLFPAPATSHSVTLTDLAERSTYYYRVASKDYAGNLTVSEIKTFVTKYSGTPPTRP